jgi:hypothetical protein
MSHDPVNGRFQKGHKQGFKKGNKAGKKFSSTNQPTKEQRIPGIDKRKRTMAKKNKAVAKRASKIVDKTFEIENIAQEKMAESDYNPVLKTIRLAKYHQNVLNLHFARFAKADGHLIEPKASHKHIHLKSFVDHCLYLLPYYSQKAPKKTVHQEVVREIKEIPKISQEDLDAASKQFDELFGDSGGEE